MVAELAVDSYPVVVTEVTGKAYRTGEHRFELDSAGGLGTGFVPRHPGGNHRAPHPPSGPGPRAGRPRPADRRCHIRAAQGHRPDRAGCPAACGEGSIRRLYRRGRHAAEPDNHSQRVTTASAPALCAPRRNEHRDAARAAPPTPEQGPAGRRSPRRSGAVARDVEPSYAPVAADSVTARRCPRSTGRPAAPCLSRLSQCSRCLT
ncbi:hypothetical protein ABWJ92_37525 [Streptomyces sp. NPDC000609]|uniref:hypothetical protein n=1 Tax=Streptomyces sp. NPDC000609 TaxID=3160957 RepID=UPI0033995D94